jgi:SNF2 family DNA or RNA helicase
MKLEQYQIEGANFLASNKHALLADDMGLGKTAQAIYGTDLIVAETILIICPASVKCHWQNELLYKWVFSQSYTVDVIEGKSYDIDPFVEVVIVNYELLLSNHIFNQLKSRKWDVLICDEAHYLKTLTSKRSKRVLGKGGLVHNANYKWMLTGTPIENKPIDLFPMLYVLAPHILDEYKSYEEFVMYFCNGYYDYWSKEPLPDGASNEKELGQRLKKFMLRRTLEHELPETSVQTISLEKNIKVLELEKELPEESYYKPMAELGALASLRQEIAMAKLPQVIQYIKDTLKTVDKIVVFAYHRNIIQNLIIALKKFEPSWYYGGMSAKQKEYSKLNFIKSPSCKVFIGQLKAVGTGTDGLQEVCHHMIFAEIDWVPFKQCIGRLKRKGQKNKVIAQILVTKDSLEEQMLGSVKSKLKSIDKILGD